MQNKIEGSHVYIDTLLSQRYLVPGVPGNSEGQKFPRECWSLVWLSYYFSSQFELSPGVFFSQLRNAHISLWSWPSVTLGYWFIGTLEIPHPNSSSLLLTTSASYITWRACGKSWESCSQELSSCQNLRNVSKKKGVQSIPSTTVGLKQWWT